MYLLSTQMFCSKMWQNTAIFTKSPSLSTPKIIISRRVMFWWCVFWPKWKISSVIFNVLRNTKRHFCVKHVRWMGTGAKANLVEAVPAIRLHLSVVNGSNVRNRALNIIYTKSQVEFLNAALNSTFAWSTTWQLPPSPDCSYDFRSTSRSIYIV